MRAVPLVAAGLAVVGAALVSSWMTPSADAVDIPRMMVTEPIREIDVIDDALWQKFAQRNGPQWWLQAKVLRGQDGNTQLDNAKYIVDRFRAAGLPDSIALAAVTNSLMESSLLSDRIQPQSKATGLFQCWRNMRVTSNMPRGGAGNGTPAFDWGDGPGLDATREQMLDRDKNTDRIIFELLHVRNTTGKEFFGVPDGELFGAKIMKRAQEGASVAEIASLWGQHIERYRPTPNGKYSFRGRVAYLLFGDITYADTTFWRKNTLPPDLPCGPPDEWGGLGIEHRPEPPPMGFVEVQAWRQHQDAVVILGHRDERCP
ncbi:MAG: hypothetical protein AB8H79_10965 [Myxococcota bacterium]